MILVSRTHPITEDYPVETKECGSATAINKTLQTEAAEAFFSPCRPLPPKGRRGRADAERLPQRSYQKKLYDNKTQYYRDKGLSEAAARRKGRCRRQPAGLFRAQLRPRR